MNLGGLLPGKVKKILNILLAILTKGKELELFDERGDPISGSRSNDRVGKAGKRF